MSSTISTNKYKCSICDLVVDVIPEGAVQIGKATGNVACYRLTNGEYHYLVSTKTGRPSGLPRTEKFKEKQKPDVIPKEE